jgi:hypothetical protein
VALISEVLPENIIGGGAAAHGRRRPTAATAASALPGFVAAPARSLRRPVVGLELRDALGRPVDLFPLSIERERDPLPVAVDVGFRCDLSVRLRLSVKYVI